MATVDYAAGSLPFSISAGDSDGDGDRDLVLASAATTLVSLLKNNGDATFAPIDELDLGGLTTWVTTADFDGDGAIDLAAANFYQQNLAVVLNRNSGCSCAHQGDIANRPMGDGVIDVFDVIEVIGIAFSGGADSQDPGCPRMRGDVNNDSDTNVFDVIYLIEIAFSGGPSPIDPCAP